MKSSLRIITIVLSFTAIIATQVAYDDTKITLPANTANVVSPELVRLVDMGFHGAAGSFFWIPTMPEVLGIYFEGSTQYLTDLAYVNAVDPKLSYPYAFSVITLPALTRLPNNETIALAIGAQGIKNADPDWRIPYYMAADYYLDLKDEKDALIYYNIAAQTPGIPEFAKTFATNFSLLPDDRAKTEALWESIAATTNDPNTKARAEAYVERFQIFDYLEAAVSAYKSRYGVFPATLDDLVSKNIIPSIPQDPFGYGLKISSGTVELDLSKPPAE